MELEQLLQQIHQAFASVRLPRKRVAPHHCVECDDVVAFLQGRTRESLDRDEVGIFGNTTIHLISPQAIQYYFPQILEKALSPEESDFLMDILYFLGSESSHTASQVSLFTKEQRQAVLNFLQFIKSNRYPDVVNYLFADELERAIKIWT